MKGRAQELLKENADRAQGLLRDNADKIEKGVGKAETFAKSRTPKHTGTIDKVAGRIRGLIPPPEQSGDKPAGPAQPGAGPQPQPPEQSGDKPAGPAQPGAGPQPQPPAGTGTTDAGEAGPTGA